MLLILNFNSSTDIQKYYLNYTYTKSFVLTEKHQNIISSPKNILLPWTYLQASLYAYLLISFASKNVKCTTQNLKLSFSLTLPFTVKTWVRMKAKKIVKKNRGSEMLLRLCMTFRVCFLEINLKGLHKNLSRREKLSVFFYRFAELRKWSDANSKFNLR